MEADRKSRDEIEAGLKGVRALLADAWRRIDELSRRVKRLEETLVAGSAHTETRPK
jgi:hypothetical protein